MFEQILYYCAYILAITLQLSAGLLLIGNTNISRKGIIREYGLRHTAIAFEENGKLANGNNLKEVVKSTWINYMAFIYLFAGYLISIFGEPLPNKVLSLVIILFLIMIIFIFTFKFAKSRSENFKPISKDELNLQDGVAFCILDADEGKNEKL